MSDKNQFNQMPESRDEIIRETWRMTQITHRAVVGDPNDPHNFPGLIQISRRLAVEIHGDPSTQTIGLKSQVDEQGRQIAKLWKVIWHACAWSGGAGSVIGGLIYLYKTFIS